MKKLLIIQTCDECHHFDNVYYDYMQTCLVTMRSVESEKHIHPIPSWCPLETYAPNIACTGLAGTQAADGDGSKPASQ